MIDEGPPKPILPPNAYSGSFVNGDRSLSARRLDTFFMEKWNLVPPDKRVGVVSAMAQAMEHHKQAFEDWKRSAAVKELGLPDEQLAEIFGTGLALFDKSSGWPKAKVNQDPVPDEPATRMLERAKADHWSLQTLNEMVEQSAQAVPVPAYLNQERIKELLQTIADSIAADMTMK
jgi:hypothetical protein